MMKLEMNERDVRRLIITGFCVLAAVLTVYVILPLSLSRNEWKNRCAEYERSIEHTAEKSSQLPSIRELHVSTAEKLKTLEAAYLPMYQSYEIDRMLTEYLKEQKVEAEFMKIVMPSDPSTVTEHEAPDANGRNQIRTAQVELRLSGDRFTLQKIMETWHLNWCGVRLTGFQWEENGISGKDAVILVNLEVRMLIKEG